MSPPRSLPWLERLNACLPDYSGYQRRDDRRVADQTIRNAIAQRLGGALENLGKVIQQCEARHAEREVGPIQTIRAEFNRLVHRVRQTSYPHAFEQAGELGDARADTLHALDHALLDLADAIVDRTQRPAVGHDWLAHLKSDQEAFERRLDARALLFRDLV